MDTLVNLQTFIAVAETGSFSEVARRSDLSVSVIAKRISQLEHQIKVPLFKRSTRRLELTDAGRRQIAAATKLLEDADELLCGFADPAGESREHLRIKVPLTLGRFYLLDLLTDFRRRHRALSMEIISLDRLVNPVQEGFDFAIGVTPGTFGGVKEIALRQMRRVLVASPDYLRRMGTPKHPRDLDRHDTLIFHPIGNIWEFEKDGQRQVIRTKGLLTSNDGFFLLKAACLGDGIACLSDYLVTEMIADKKLVPILQDYETDPFWIYLQIPEPLLNTRRVRSLIDYLKQALMETPPWQAGGRKPGAALELSDADFSSSAASRSRRRHREG